MTQDTIPPLLTYVPPPPTKENLDFADLAVIDISKAKTPDGRVKLARELRDAMNTHGFFYVVNHGFPKEKTERIFSIANFCFDGVDEQEKRLYMGQSESIFEGYKPRQTWLIDQGVHDQVEHYNIKCQVDYRPHPEPLRPFLPLIKEFSKFNYYEVLYPILRLLAIGLELPEDTLIKQHDFDASSHTSVRFMKYHPRSADEEQKTNNVWLKGHTDFGSISCLWSQPISGLQILSPDGRWRWVKHIDNALVINAGDALHFQSAGIYPATRHRVVKPPQDQANLARIGVFFFVTPNDGTRLVPFEESPVLQRLKNQLGGESAGAGPGAIGNTFDRNLAPTIEQWRMGRTKSYGRVPTKRTAEGDEEEIISGIVVKHWN